MSVALHTQAKDSINKAYAATQSWNTNPANIRLPDSINTKRPKLSNRQIASRYLKSIEGNPNIDINKRTQSSPDIDINSQHVSAQNNLRPENLKRTEVCDIAAKELKIDEHYRTQCKNNFYFYEYKGNADSAVQFSRIPKNIEYILIGSSIPGECVCLNDLTEFVVCSDKNLEQTVGLGASGSYPKQIVNYRNMTSFNGENPCGGLSRANCFTPAITPDEINRQINEALESEPATRVYLTQAQLDAYLDWRKTNSTQEEFPYILVSDRQPKASEELSGGGIAGSVIGVLMGIGGAIGAAACVMKSRKNQTTVSATTVTTVPIHTQPTVTNATAHSIGSANPSITIPSAANSSANTGAISLDIPPAGHEG